jgi:hypothetical protein
VFRGRFKSVLVREESDLRAVARYLHLNPVRIGGLGLSKEDQRRAQLVGCPDPGAALIARRLKVLRDHRGRSWRMHDGLEAAPEWLTREPIQSARGGRSRQERRAALSAYTEQPIRPGRLDNPWEGTVAGVGLGEEQEAWALVRGAERSRGGPEVRSRESAAGDRPEWSGIVGAAEAILGRSWQETVDRHGDWGRDAGGGDTAAGVEVGGGGGAGAGTD